MTQGSEFMFLRKLIQERLSSQFNIYQKNYQRVDNQKILSEYNSIKSFILNHYEEDAILGLYLTNEYCYLLTLLACQEIGICYVPLKSGWPKERIEQIQNLTNLTFIITDENIANIISAGEHEGRRGYFEVNGESPLYIMFTSGSTGEPKGVVIKRNSYENFLSWIDEFFKAINSDDKLINSTAYTFDVSLMEVGLFLVKNVHFYCSNLDQNSLVLGKEISDLKITVAVTVPNNFNLILSDRIFPELNLSSLRHVLLAGSKITPALIERFERLLPAVSAYNCYGPTEATIYCIVKKLNLSGADVERGAVSIGSPIRGCEAIILKDDNVEASSYESGELLVGGVQLMKEYFNRPNLTKKALFKHGEKFFYRTGDIVFQNKLGNFFVLGRADDTVKVSGQRVNLSDVDSYIANFSYIEEVATIAIDDPVKDSVLIAFIVLSCKTIDEKKLRSDMKASLLSFQIPSKVFFREELPLNSSGKISKKKLTEEYLGK